MPPRPSRLMMVYLPNAVPTRDSTSNPLIPSGTREVSHVGHESQIGPNAGIPRCSRPCTTCRVTVLLDTQMTASAPDWA